MIQSGLQIIDQESFPEFTETVQNQLPEIGGAAMDNAAYQHILDALDLGIVVLNTEGFIQSYNTWFEQHILETSRPFFKKHISEILPNFFDLLPQSSQSQGVRIEIRKPGQPKSQYIRYTTSLKPEVIEQNFDGYFVFIFDATEQTYHDFHIEQAREEAEEAKATEKLFLANMSHEMRTPLNSIIGMSHMLLETPLSDEQQEYVSLMCASADVLQNLVSDVLDLSELQAGKLVLQQKEFDPVVLIHAVHRTFELQADAKPIEINCEIDPILNEVSLIGDDLLLNQMLNNLMSNAVKFTPQGMVRLKVQVLEKTQEQVTLCFAVEDEGIGIPEDKLSVIFQTFRQVDVDIKRRFGGTGLGLAITKEIVDLQNGSMTVASEIGMGTRFEIVISYQCTNRKPKPTGQNKYTQQLELLKYVGKVLVVEDNKMNRRYISKLFDKWKVPYVMAHDGREAALLVKTEVFALIMMDIQMPNMDGYETTIRIRNEHNLNQNTPILALTASALPSNIDRAYQVGMTDYLSKPFSPAQLLEKITLPSILNNCKTAQNAESESAMLNEAILRELYEDDFQYAADMFEIYLESMLPQFDKVDQLIHESKQKEAAQIVHKLKPASHMVGLPYLENQLETLEDLLLKSSNNMTQILHTWTTIMNFLQQALPFLIAKHEQLKRTSYEQESTHH